MAAQHAQSVDGDEIVTQAAQALVANQSLDDAVRGRAASWATRLAVQDGDEAALDVSILVRAGQIKAAMHVLLDMLLEVDESTDASTDDDDPLDDLLGGGDAAVQPQPAPARPTRVVRNRPTAPATTTPTASTPAPQPRSRKK